MTNTQLGNVATYFDFMTYFHVIGTKEDTEYRITYNNNNNNNN